MSQACDKSSTSLWQIFYKLATSLLQSCEKPLSSLRQPFCKLARNLLQAWDEPVASCFEQVNFRLYCKPEDTFCSILSIFTILIKVNSNNSVFSIFSCFDRESDHAVTESVFVFHERVLIFIVCPCLTSLVRFYTILCSISIIRPF